MRYIQGTKPDAESALRKAALASVQLQLDRQSGRRANDPLDQLVTHETVARYLSAAESITGRQIDHNDRTGDIPARVRSALRRWAVVL